MEIHLLWPLTLLLFAVYCSSPVYSLSSEHKSPLSMNHQQEQERRELAAFATNILIPAARKEILPFWRQPDALVVDSKYELDRSDAQTTSPVTMADRNAEAAMRRCIEERYPDHGIIGEEYGEKSAAISSAYCWVLDPIDGTKSFITGKPLFGTLVGLCYHGVPVVGVIDHPAMNEQWVGIVFDTAGDGPGGITTFNGQPIVHNTTSKQQKVQRLEDAILYATTPHMFRKGFEETMFETIRNSCSMALYGADCYAYGLVASGFGAHLVVEADLGVYDYTALVPVLQGAGGCLTDWKGKDLVLSRHEECKGRVVASCNPVLHQQALALLSGEDEDGS